MHGDCFNVALIIRMITRRKLDLRFGISAQARAFLPDDELELFLGF